MTADSTTQQWQKELRQTPEYAARRLTIKLIEQCEERREELGLSYAELARRMGVTRAYIGKLLGGTQNSTVASLVKLARALDCEVSLNLVPGGRESEGGSAPTTASRQSVKEALVQVSSARDWRNARR